MKKIKVSIILTAYNIQDFIGDAIFSLIDQEFEDYEVIIVDDGSLDKTYDVIEKYAKEFDFLKPYKIKHQGAGFARNFGYSKAKGEYVLFLDGDDIFHTSMLYDMYKEIVTQKADICMCNSKEFSKNKSNIVKIHDSNKFYYPIGWAWDKMFKKSFLDEYQINFCNLSSSNDLSFTFCAWFMAKKIVKMKDFLVYRRMWQGSVSSERKEENAFLALFDLKEKLLRLRKFEENKEYFYNVAQKLIYWHFKTGSKKVKQNIISLIKKYEANIGALNLIRPKYKKFNWFYRDAYFYRSYSIIYSKYTIGKFLGFTHE